MHSNASRATAAPRATALFVAAALLAACSGGSEPASPDATQQPLPPLLIVAASATTPPLGTLTFAADGGSGTGITWSLATNASGGSVTQQGVYTAGPSGDVSDVVRVSDSRGNVATQAVAVTAAVSIAGATDAPPRGQVAFVASGGSGTGFSWSFAANASGGSLAADGTYTAGPTGGVSDVVAVSDSLGNLSTMAVAVGPGVSIAPSAPASPPRGSLDLAASGGSGAGFAWSLATNASGGSVTPEGRYTAGPTGGVSDVVEVTDSLGNLAAATVAVGSGVSIAPGAATVRALGTVTFAASGGSGAGFVFALAANGSGGAVSPTGVYTAGTTVGVSDVVQVSDPLGNSAAATIEVVPTEVPTAPAGLPPIAGLSPGYRVVASAGMALPAVTTVPIPQPIGGSIADVDAAVRLGKALFWDVQAGSDGLVACASCHFAAGTDTRRRNTIHAGPDLTFQAAAGPGATFVLQTFAGDDRVGSSGVLSRAFTSISSDLADPADVCQDVAPADPVQALFFAANERLVTGRNAPTTVGAVFNRDNFWDGRARHDFNGLNPIGSLGGPGPYVENASLASQAVGPPLSDVEMSCLGRAFNGPNSLGAKLVPRTPLRFQAVHSTDSALGVLANPAGNGLDCGFPDRLCTYADLIAAAFGTGGLAGQAAVDAYVANFASIFGQAVQAYEATLIPDRTPYDLGLLTANQVAGLQALRDNDCTSCHAEPEFTDATVRFFADGPANPNGSDKGYHNIGAARTAEDLGRAASPGGTDTGSPNNAGAFKTPTLRNVKLTAPYMHNGSLATLQAVVDFYDTNPGDPPGPGVQIQNPEIDDRAVGAGFGGGGAGAAQAIDFMRNGLTDCRVEHDMAPFDHPSLTIPNGPSLPARGAGGDGTAICP
jgi:cytochrome c peroxidase